MFIKTDIVYSDSIYQLAFSFCIKTKPLNYNKYVLYYIHILTLLLGLSSLGFLTSRWSGEGQAPVVFPASDCAELRTAPTGGEPGRTRAVCGV